MAMNQNAKEFYEFGPFQLDPQESLLLCKGSPIHLAPKLFEVLLVLVRNAGSLVDKDALLGQIWPDSFVEEGNLTKNVHLLRRMLEEGGGTAGYIETVPKRGYRFTGTVKKYPARPSSAPSVVQAPGAGLQPRIKS